jgi:hypothetical protein
MLPSRQLRVEEREESSQTRTDREDPLWPIDIRENAVR